MRLTLPHHHRRRDLRGGEWGPQVQANSAAEYHQPGATGQLGPGALGGGQVQGEQGIGCGWGSACHRCGR